MYLEEEDGVFVGDAMNGFGLPAKGAHSILLDDQGLEELAELLRISPRDGRLETLASKVNIRRAETAN